MVKVYPNWVRVIGTNKVGQKLTSNWTPLYIAWSIEEDWNNRGYTEISLQRPSDLGSNGAMVQNTAPFRLDVL